MREEFIKKPDGIQALFRVIPIQRLVPTTLEEIVKATTELGAAIGPDEHPTASPSRRDGPASVATR